MLIYRGILITKEQLTNDVLFLRFKLDKELLFTPGQYIIVKINNYPRAYSIASNNFDNHQLELIVKIIPNGLASQYFLNLPLNSFFEFFGPYGQFVLKDNQKEKILLATGTGIAPFLSMINSFNNYSFKLYWGLKKLTDVFFINKLQQFSSQKDLHFKICLSQEKTTYLKKEFFDHGHIDDCFLKDLKGKNLNDYEYYICGNKEIVLSIKNKLIKQGINIQNIIVEKF